MDVTVFPPNFIVLHCYHSVRLSFFIIISYSRFNFENMSNNVGIIALKAVMDFTKPVVSQEVINL